MVYEYKVIPAPAKGRKARGVRKPEDKFALAVQESMNEMAQLGWEFLRSETMPNTERTGLTRRTTTERTVLVFRREIEQDPKSSLEATLREVEKPKPTVAAPVEEHVAPPRREPEVAETQVAQHSSEDATVVSLNTPKVAESDVEIPEPVSAPAPAPKRLAAIDSDSFPDPRAPEAPEPGSQALYTKESVNKPAKTAKANALPAALRSRASQSQDGKKA